MDLDVQNSGIDFMFVFQSGWHVRLYGHSIFTFHQITRMFVFAKEKAKIFYVLLCLYAARSAWVSQVEYFGKYFFLCLFPYQRFYAEMDTVYTSVCWIGGNVKKTINIR